MLETKDDQPGNEHHIEVVTQGSRDKVEQIKRDSEQKVGGCFARFFVVIDFPGDADQRAERGSAKNAIDQKDGRGRTELLHNVGGEHPGEALFVEIQGEHADGEEYEQPSQAAARINVQIIYVCFRCGIETV